MGKYKTPNMYLVALPFLYMVIGALYYSHFGWESIIYLMVAFIGYFNIRDIILKRKQNG